MTTVNLITDKTIQMNIEITLMKNQADSAINNKSRI